MGVYDSNIKRDVDEINKLLKGVKPSTPKVPTTINPKYRSFITAIKSKPFLLLAGISGTGKSRVAAFPGPEYCEVYQERAKAV